MNKTIFGIFDDRENAEEAINNLEAEGFNPKDISIVMKDKKEGEKLAENTGADVASETASGITTGAVIGGIAGLLAAVAIPGLGAFLVGGPIAAALGLTGAAASTVSGAATGALAGGLLGALTGLGLSEDEAKVYEESVNSGAILVAVPSDEGKESQARSIMEKNSATQVKAVTMSTDSNSHHHSDDASGKGWHDDSKHHADAAKGDEPHN